MDYAICRGCMDQTCNKEKAILKELKGQTVSIVERAQVVAAEPMTVRRLTFTKTITMMQVQLAAFKEQYQSISVDSKLASLISTFRAPVTSEVLLEPEELVRMQALVEDLSLSALELIMAATQLMKDMFTIAAEVMFSIQLAPLMVQQVGLLELRQVVEPMFGQQVAAATSQQATTSMLVSSQLGALVNQPLADLL